MSFLNVSGLGSRDEEQNALTKLAGGSASLLDAINRVSAPPEFPAPPATVPADSPLPKADHSATKVSTTKEAPKVSTAAVVKKTLKTKPSEKSNTSHFTAESSSDLKELPPLNELVHPKLLRPLTDAMKIESLTRIQQLCWGSMVDQTSDVLIRSETGSGKTLAYVLPTVHRILKECDSNPINRDVGTVCIIMSPTRELILQVVHTCTVLLRCAQFLTVGGVHGGENRHKEKARLRKGIHLLVCTPGRLLDHLKSTTCFTLSRLETIVMDEADRLLDLGFEKAIREIMGILPEKCPNFKNVKRVLVSATITDGVERLSHFALRQNVRRIGETEDTFSIPAKLRQNFVAVPVKHRLAVLFSFIRAQLDSGAEKIIVFVSTADAAEFLYYVFSRIKNPFKQSSTLSGRTKVRRSHSKGVKKMVEKANQHIHNEEEEIVTFAEEDASDADEEPTPQMGGKGDGFIDVNVFKLHGNMTQTDRASVFNAFKHGSNTHLPTNKGVLLCTDVAARGLDMPRIDWIVHYDPPTDPTSYIHRIGRTARIGNSGDSILFLAPTQVGYASYLTNFIHSQIQSENKGEDSMTERKYERFLFYLTKLDTKSNHFWPHSTATLERAICRLVMGRDNDEGATDSLQRIAFFAYQSYVRAYAGLPREIKNAYFNEDLHLGHVAHSFGIDKSPKEVQRELQQYIKEDRVLSRDNRKGTTSFTDNSRRKRQRVEVEHDERYHSMVVQKQRKLTRDWAEKRKENSTKIKPLQFSEFDA
ncbi:DEAD/DEAH box helicase/Type III restriction enzyme, res subunit/Helicase conserved C-terminal domain/Domain of unknown function (DUF4217), putative [Angomonas deanei]|uniref:ATP-dependent RNA helicase n=1 Tax=Angomonas deanei TaxID=59799 RepID=A0A7G2CBE0_9TRYP|nr:DEAD/DEAH box helicase/Type III restriction enzyme, res subunit/Helicase conserved C-terminal domain/Domain of unknown function (DUF4217), putative [Angomonas deanei]